MARKKPSLAALNLDALPFSKEELLAAVARELASQATSGGDRKKRAEPEPDWMKVTKECPQCGHKGPVIPDFGIKPPIRGKTYAQSWCRECRSKVNYHVRPRKYDVSLPANTKRR